MIVLASGPEIGADQTFSSTSKNVGAELSGDLPRGDFDLRLRLTWTDPGSIVDTVGLNAAKVGSFAINVIPNEHLEFRLWDGASWITIDSGQRAPKGVETAVRVVRRSGEIHLETSGVLGPSKRVMVALTQDKAYLGDFPGDQNWTPRANPNLGFIGSVTVAYVGPPPALPTSVVHDPTGQLSGGETARIKAVLEGLAAASIPLAVTFSGDDTPAKGESVWIDGDLQASGLLPRGGGVLAFGKSSGWVYRRPPNLNAKLPFERIVEDWKKLAPLPSQTERAASLLEGLLATVQGRPSAPPTAAVVPAAAKMLATAKIGPGGGEVVAPQGVRVDVPQGALLKEQTLTISELGTTGTRFRIEAGDANLVFLRPVKLSFPVPKGADTRNLRVFHHLSDEVALSVPDASVENGMLTVSTNTLSEWTLSMGRAGMEVAVGGAALIGTGVGIVLTAPATPFAAAVGTMLVIGYAGWRMGDSAHTEAIMTDLEGPLPAPGFELRWEKATTPAYPAVLAYFSKVDGRLLLLTKVVRSEERAEPVLEQGTDPVKTIRIKENGQEKEYRAEDLKTRLIPLAVLFLLADLQRSRQVYTSMGFDVPENTGVAIHSRLGAAPSGGNETNAGEWDGKILSVNTQDLKGHWPLKDGIRSTLAHEYWHVVAARSGFKESFPGMEESVATAMESLVFASPEPVNAGGKDFVTLRNWISVGPVLSSGIRVVGAGQHSVRRGYQLWPWPKFVFHVKGLAAYRDLVAGKVTKAQEEAWWPEFAKTMVIKEFAVPDPAKFSLGGQTLTTVTNMGDSALFNAPASAALKWGIVEKGRFEPLSLAWHGVVIPARDQGGPPCPIILRRAMSHQPERYVGQNLLVGSCYPFPKTPPAMDQSQVQIGTGRIVLPPSWDAEPGIKKMPIVLSPVSKPIDLSEDALLVYRLAPPASFKTTFQSQNTLVIEIPPDKTPGGLMPMVHFQGYRLFIRGKDGKERQVADLLYRLEGQPPVGRARIDPQTHRATVELPLTEAEISGIGVATIDQGNPATEPSLISATFWKGDAKPTANDDLLPALQKTTHFIVTLNGVVLEDTEPNFIGTQAQLGGASLPGSLPNQVAEIIKTAKEGGKDVAYPIVHWSGSSFTLSVDSGAVVASDTSPYGTTVTRRSKKLNLSGTYDPATRSLKKVEYIWESSETRAFTPDLTSKRRRSSLEGPAVPKNYRNVSTIRLTFDSVPAVAMSVQDPSRWSVAVSFALDGKTVRPGCFGITHVEIEETDKKSINTTKRVAVGPGKGFQSWAPGAYIQFYLPKP